MGDNGADSEGRGHKKAPRKDQLVVRDLFVVAGGEAWWAWSKVLQVIVRLSTFSPGWALKIGLGYAGYVCVCVCV